MEKEEIVLRKSRRRLVLNATVSGFATVFCIINAFMHWENNAGKWFAILVAIVTLAVCLYSIKEWRDRKTEIVITIEGIRLRGEGFYAWSSIEKFSTYVDEGTTTLRLYMRERPIIRFEISDLELEKEELIELILTFGKTAGLYYS